MDMYIQANKIASHELFYNCFVTCLHVSKYKDIYYFNEFLTVYTCNMIHLKRLLCWTSAFLSDCFDVMTNAMVNILYAFLHIIGIVILK